MSGLDADYVEASADALFTAVPGADPGDFVPRADSPAVDHGTATDAPPTDLAGNARPQGAGIDLGALERCDGPCMQPPPGGSDGGLGPGVGSGGCCDAGGDRGGSLALAGLVALCQLRRRPRAL